MERSNHLKNNQKVVLNIPWDRNTARAWFYSLLIVGVGMVIFDQLGILNSPIQRRVYKLPSNIIAINIGSGDGSGVSKGNMQEEGKATSGEAPISNIHDAQTAKESNKRTRATTSDPNLASNIIPVDEVSSSDNQKENGNSNLAVGNAPKKNDDPLSRGLGSKGTGKGKGDGFGEIEWGGGGSRRVLKKVIPKFPSGVRSSSQIILVFRVLPDGTVSSVTPKQKANPIIERAAIAALEKWKFSPLEEGGEVQTGQIPLTFVLR